MVDSFTWPQWNSYSGMFSLEGKKQFKPIQYATCHSAWLSSLRDYGPLHYVSLDALTKDYNLINNFSIIATAYLLTGAQHTLRAGIVRDDQELFHQIIASYMHLLRYRDVNLETVKKTSVSCNYLLHKFIVKPWTYNRFCLLDIIDMHTFAWYWYTSIQTGNNTLVTFLLWSSFQSCG